MKLPIARVSCFTALIALLLSGCSVKTHQPVWPMEMQPTASTHAAQLLLDTAMAKFNSAASSEDVLDSMDAFRDVLQADPGNREAYTYLCNQYILLGTAYTAKRREKSAYYNQAMMNCELAMYTNPLFRQEVDNGSRPWEAAHTLEAKEAPAMLFWVTALQYEFKEAMPLPSKMVNVRWMQYALVFLDRIRKVAPLYGNGAVELAYTVSYCVLPGFFGGDRQECYRYMDKTVDKSDGFLLGRWARGRFFYQVTGDRDAARRDLQWVVEQDATQYNDALPWRVHFQQDAALELSRKSH